MTEMIVHAPQSVWKRPISLNLRGFFAALGHAAVSVGTGQWDALSKDAVDVAAAFGLARGVEEQAGLLIGRALLRSAVELLEPYRNDVLDAPLDMSKECDARLAELAIEIDDRFLAHPRELAIVGEFQALVEQWLAQLELPGHSAKTIAARLPGRFVYMLHRESLDHRDEYAGLFAELHGEFGEAWRRERSWEEYRHWFEAELDAPVFTEDFGLRQIYLWPRAYTLEGSTPGAHGRRGHSAEPRQERRLVVELKDALDNWVASCSRDDVFRVISGEPGAGKSSFARMYAAHRMAAGERVLLVPLHMLDVESDLGEALASLCRQTPPFPDAPFGDESTPLLLILDGLDELSKQGQSGSRVAQVFVQHLRKVVDSRNLGGVRLRVLLSGRPIAVQDVAEADFRTPGQVLYLLPYAVSDKSEPNCEWIDPEYRLAEDQRHTWWWRYGQLTCTDHAGLPAELMSAQLFDTTTQPLLGYLLALVHRDAHASGQVFGSKVSRNEIYARLIRAVYERDYNRPAREHVAAGGLGLEQFEALLEEMALAAWHEDARVVRVSAVVQLCEKSGLTGLLEHYMQTSQAGVAQLFTAFYFRRHGSRVADGESFEFTHKSFAEYLVARRFVTALEHAAEALAERDASTGRRMRGKDEQAVLLDWLEVFGPSGLTDDLLDYLAIEVRLQSSQKKEVGHWQDAVRRLIGTVLREGMPCERINPGLRFMEMQRWANNAERALLVMLQCCSGATQRMSDIDWPSETALREWVARLQAKAGQVQLCLGWVSMAGQSLRNASLRNASLRNADLRNADLRNADLRSADLRSADLRSANLWNASLRSANLWNASLQIAGLRNADLRNADLRNANLRNANLWNADLRNANLWNANLRNANFLNASLLNTNLLNADLRGAHITPGQLAGTLGTPAHFPDDPV
jgi:hypothetical protein